MILSEKIMTLRKQNGWSQEELADKLGISRQSVSKWESTASIPDLDKIIRLSNIFGVSTDYLLKDEIDEIIWSESGDPVEKETARSISLEEANTYLNLVRKHSVRISLAVFLLVCSPICLILLGGITGYGQTGLSEDMVGGLGCAILLLLIAIGVIILILDGMKLSEYEYLEKENITLEYGVQGAVEMKKKSFAPTFRKCIAAGVSLFILGVIPLLLSAGLTSNELVYIYCLCFLLFFVACGVFLCTWSGIIQGSYAKLLQEEDYTPRNKALNKQLAFFPGFYWCAATAIYLGISFFYDSWDRSWIIWPVAGVLYAAVYNLLKTIVSSRNAR